jgi:hypothetical protein
VTRPSLSSRGEERDGAATRRACGQGRIGQELLNQLLPSACRTQDHAFGHDAIADEVPQGAEKLAGKGGDHLFAQAGCILGARPIPLGQGALLLEVEESPRELDHPFLHSSVAGSGKPLLAAFIPALVGRAR